MAQPGPAFGHHYRRSVPYPGGPLLHAAPGRDGRAGHQGRGAGRRRRRAPVRPVHQRQIDLFRLGQPRQGVDRARPQGGQGSRDFRAPAWTRPTPSSRTSGPGRWSGSDYGWETLHKRYPRLIYAAASGFGHTGPYSHYPSYDMVVQGLGGIMSITGIPDGPLVRIGTSIGDLAGGLYTTIALNAALLHREQTGEATKVDVALFDCQLALLENAIMRYTTPARSPARWARAIRRSPRSRRSPPRTVTSSSPPAMTGFGSS